jgi:hypothetical protein
MEQEIVEVNSKKYQRKPDNKNLLEVIAKIKSDAGDLFNSHNPNYFENMIDKYNIRNIDVVQEFGLIEQKQSKLSFNQRKEVVAEFKHLYKEFLEEN